VAFKKKVAFMATKLLKMGDSIEVLQEKATLTKLTDMLHIH